MKFVGDAEKSRADFPSHCLQFSGEGRRAGVEWPPLTPRNADEQHYTFIVAS